MDREHRPGVAYREREVHVPHRGDAVMRELAAALAQAGWVRYTSFDLQTAIRPLGQCTCPHHGTDRCTCQYAVWCVCPPTGSPVLVTIHSRDEDTWIAYAAAEEVGSQLERVIVQAVTALSPAHSIHTR